jgi:hypothetical protein
VTRTTRSDQSASVGWRCCCMRIACPRCPTEPYKHLMHAWSERRGPQHRLLAPTSGLACWPCLRVVGRRAYAGHESAGGPQSAKDDCLPTPSSQSSLPVLECSKVTSAASLQSTALHRWTRHQQSAISDRRQSSLTIDIHSTFRKAGASQGRSTEAE